MQLYDFPRSGAAYRTRIALNLKELDYEQTQIHLTKDGGDQFKPDYVALNPERLVPFLIDGDARMSQSMAIMEYLEEVYPAPAILPADTLGRARVRSLSQIIACDLHPINNLRVRLYLVDGMGLTPDDRATWMCHWIETGLTAYEKRLAEESETGKFSHGDTPGMADACLIPQLFNARLNKCDVSMYPNIMRVEANCQAHPAFQKAHPDNQPEV